MLVSWETVVLEGEFLVPMEAEAAEADLTELEEQGELVARPLEAVLRHLLTRELAAEAADQDRVLEAADLVAPVDLDALS